MSLNHWPPVTAKPCQGGNTSNFTAWGTEENTGEDYQHDHTPHLWTRLRAKFLTRLRAKCSMRNQPLASRRTWWCLSNCEISWSPIHQHKRAWGIGSTDEAEAQDETNAAHCTDWTDHVSALITSMVVIRSLLEELPMINNSGIWVTSKKHLASSWWHHLLAVQFTGNVEVGYDHHVGLLVGGLDCDWTIHQCWTDTCDEHLTWAGASVRLFPMKVAVGITHLHSIQDISFFFFF